MKRNFFKLTGAAAILLALMVLAGCPTGDDSGSANGNDSGSASHTAFYGTWKGTNGYAPTWFYINDTEWEFYAESIGTTSKRYEGTYICSENEAIFTATRVKDYGDWQSSTHTFVGSISELSGKMANYIFGSYSSYLYYTKQ
jgi:hypothetical protein